MFRMSWLSLMVGLYLISIVQCDITNLNEFLNLLKNNSETTYSLGFVTKANVDVIKRYLTKNIKIVYFDQKSDLLKAIDNQTITAGVTTGQLAQDLDALYHVFSSLIISPQAMLLAPEYNEQRAPYGLRNQNSSDLFDALNAAIAALQRDTIDETLFVKNNRTNIARVYTCHQDEQLPVRNRNDTTGYLRDILLYNVTLKVGGLGPVDWGAYDGNYNLSIPTGFYPQLLDNIVKELGELKGTDGIAYSDKIYFDRIYFKTPEELFQALLNGTIHTTDVYILIDAPYSGTNTKCSNETQCFKGESCQNGTCQYPKRPRSLHFYTTCTTASRDTKFITRKDKSVVNNTQTTTAATSQTPATPRTRWIAFVLLFFALFGAIFLALLILVRRKAHYRIQQTLQGGFGKFARLQEESEIPIEGGDAFDDQTVQSPTEITHSHN